MEVTSLVKWLWDIRWRAWELCFWCKLTAATQNQTFDSFCCGSLAPLSSVKWNEDVDNGDEVRPFTRLTSYGRGRHVTSGRSSSSLEDHC